MEFDLSKELEGTLLAFIGMLIYGFHPVVVKYGTVFMSSLTFSSVSALLASVIIFCFLSSRKRFYRFRRLDVKQLILLIFVGVFSTGLAFIFFFKGTNLSIGMNSGIILRTEVLFSIILSYIFLKEKITLKQLFYTLLILIGLIIVLGRGLEFDPQVGDFLLVLTPVCWQIGHVISRKIPLDPYSIAMGRNFFGGIMLVFFAFIYQMIILLCYGLYFLRLSL